MDASLVLDNFFGRSRILPIIKGFQKVQHEVSYFPYVRKNENLPYIVQIVAYTVKIVKFLIHIIFIPWDASIICKMNEKSGQMY